MRKYRLSTKFRGQNNELADYVSLSSINHYTRLNSLKDNNLDQNLNKVYIRNFYEYHHRKRPGEGKTAKLEYNEELKKENKKKRLKELESQISFDRTSSSSFDSTENDDHNEQVNGYTNGKLNGDLKTNGKESNLTNGFNNKLKNSRKSTNKYTRTRDDRNSREFFDALLSNNSRKIQLNFENEYKKCVKTYKELNLAKQIQAYQLETLNDNFDQLDEQYNCLNHKFKFVNRECKLIEKDIERLKTEYYRLIKDLIKKNNLIKENNYIPIYNEIKFNEDLDSLGDLNNYERSYDKYNYYIDLNEYRRLNKLNSELLLNRNLIESCESLNNLDNKIDKSNDKIKIEINGFDNEFENSKDEFINDKDNKFENDKNELKLLNNELDKQEIDNKLNEQIKFKNQVDDILWLFISRLDCSFFFNKINQLLQDNCWFKSKIKRLQFDISNEKRKNNIRKNQENGIVDFEFSNNLDITHKPINRHSRHTINVINRRSSNLNNQLTNKSINRSNSRLSVLNVFEIPTQKIEIFQMKLKLQRKELELKIDQLKKMKELVDCKLRNQDKTLENSKLNEVIYSKETDDLKEQVKKLKIKEQQLFKENENLLKKVHQLTKK